MNDPYDDILSLTDSKPIWWDVHDVPRFAPFRPGMGAYGRPTECLLVLARARGGPEYLQLICGHTAQFERADHLTRSKTLAMGEPPAGLHAENGDLSVEPVKVLEYWRRDPNPFAKWQRLPEFEIDLVD
ncbi:hypothetical protein [Mesorhizobium sp. M7A.F.Ca.ET.027.03.2.1]|uniref:hypothetical protein n=1 Tax=Mesorhizobium sp. M7A.F.Ca.ET.027.03.2.1 TaxID=2496656 RepID=UPI000FC9F2E8|nr:hypothetical protein [Mesorhizobium sp. M7A.F.Ca.ET.027.03.2.1]RVD66044.1 hypothetical protein EN750_05245 [Mesorhizobium sp. M7A.F.Ca.ET.027.03.2.1]